MSKTLWSVDPEPDESCMSWVLRVAKENFLPGPWHLFKQAGLSPSNLGLLTFDAPKLAALTGTSMALLAPIACVRPERKAARVVFRGHHIGRRHVRHERPQVCPACLSERSLARGVWDLNLVSACPRHGLRLLSACPECGDQLRWLRHSVAECRCKASLSGANTNDASEAAVAVSAALEVALSGDLLAWTSAFGSHNAVVAAWSRTPLSHVLASIAELARLWSHADGAAPRCDRSRVIECAGEALLRWPEEAQDIIRRFVESRLATSARRSRQGRQPSLLQMAGVERFKFAKVARLNGVTEDVIDVEFMRFQATIEPSVVDLRTLNKMQSNGIQPEWISIGEAARRLNIANNTMTGLVERGLVEVKQDASATYGECLVRASSLDATLKGYKVLKMRQAMERTGLPRHVLLALRASGDLSHSNRAVRFGSIAAVDLDELCKRWTRVATSPPPNGDAVVSMQQALRHGHEPLHLMWKSELVRRVLRGLIPVYGTSSSGSLDATLSLSDVLKLKAEFTKTALSIGEVATALGLTMLGVVQLIASRRLTARFDAEVIHVAIADLRAFSSDYRRVSTLGHGFKAGKLIASVCITNCIDSWSAEGRSGEATFIRAKDCARAYALARDRFGTNRQGRLDLRSLADAHAASDTQSVNEPRGL